MASADVAGAVARAAAETGTGFLLARIACDRILDGTLDPQREDFAQLLRGSAVLLLAGDESGELARADRALLGALAIAPEPGIPVGDVWAAAAAALDDGAAVGEPTQLDLLFRIARFVIEERCDGEVVYRLFHPALRATLREQLELDDEAALRAARALLTLRDRQAGDWQQPDAVSPFLRRRLPLLVVETGDRELAAGVVEGAPDDVLDVLVRALHEAAAEERARGARAASRKLVQRALLLLGDRDGPVKARALIAQAEAVLDYDMWRDGREMALTAMRIVEEQLADDPTSLVLLTLALQSTTTLAHCLGQGGFDTRAGADHVAAALERLAPAPADVQLALATATADLLETFPNSLGFAVGPSAMAEASGGAARIRAWLLVAGREDLRIPLSVSLTYLGLAKVQLGAADAIGVMRRAASTALVASPLPPEAILAANPTIGELVQHLGLVGRHDEALAWLDGAIGAYEPAVARAAPADGFPLALAGLLELRSTVCSMLGDGERALADAERMVELARAHREALNSGAGLLAALALRLLDQGRERDAVELLERQQIVPGDGPAGGLAREEELLLAIAQGRVLAATGEPAQAVELLDATLASVEKADRSPRPTIAARRFVTYGLELRVGLELAGAHAAAGDPGAGEAALERAARAFLRLEASHSPLRLLHVERWLLTACAPALRHAAAELGDTFETAASDPWATTLTLLDRQGPEALAAVLTDVAIRRLDDAPIDRLTAYALDGDLAAAGELLSARGGDGWLSSALLMIERKLVEALDPDREVKRAEALDGIRADDIEADIGLLDVDVLEDGWLDLGVEEKLDDETDEEQGHQLQ